MKQSAQITWYDSVDSTNSVARSHIDSLANLSVISARFQTAGRGQGDHKWHSEPDQNLMFTVVLKFGSEEGDLAPLKATDELLITQIITMALRHFLLEQYGIEARIKWPNDIYVGQGKICGILIENILSGREVASSIIGVGLDVNQTTFPSDLPNPVSIAQLTGSTYDLHETLETLVGYITQSAELSNSDEGRQRLDEEFNKYMFRLPGDEQRPL